MEEEKDWKKKLSKNLDNYITNVSKEDISSADIDLVGKLVDIQKDIKNIEYWEEKEMMYRGDYGRNYNGSYGRRGVKGTGRGRYRGNDYMGEMLEHYNTFNEVADEAYNGNYGAEDEMIKSVDGIMKNIYEIVGELSEVNNPEVMSIIKKYAKKIQEMA